MKKYLVVLVLSLFLLGCTSNAPQQLDQESAVRLLVESGCFWNPAEDGSNVSFLDPDWVISKDYCLGKCYVNALTKEVNIDVNQMCTNGPLPPDDLPSDIEDVEDLDENETEILHPIAQAALDVFEERGCSFEEDGVTCVNQTFDGIQCDAVYRGLSDDGNALNLTLLYCGILPNERNLTVSEGEYFKCSGGLMYLCSSYVTWIGERFVQLKNTNDLAALVAPIQSEKEALDFLLAAYKGRDSLELINASFSASTSTQGENFIVKLYELVPEFGCFDQQDVFEITYQVTPAGLVSEQSREKVHTESVVGGTICVD